MSSQPKGAPVTLHDDADPSYPNIEGFIEYAGRPEIEDAFSSIKEGLEGLKGPKAENAKKVRKAIERTEELLQHLLGGREKLEAQKKKPKK
jgi:hypothetical protein